MPARLRLQGNRPKWDGRHKRAPVTSHAALAWNVQDPKSTNVWRYLVSKLLRGAVAGWGASKLGGGCLTTILIFFLLWWGLGHFHIFQ